jgi:hypothetical protein
MMWPASLYANNPSEENGPEVSDIKDSGCTDKTRANSPSGLVPTKGVYIRNGRKVVVR